MILALWTWITKLGASNLLLLTLIVVTGVSSSLVAYLLERRTKPALKFGRISKNDEPAYFIDVIKKKGQIKAKSCEGWLDVENTNVTHAPTVWVHEDQRLYDIGDFMALRLFRTDNDGLICFPVAHVTQGYIENNQTLNQFLTRDLKIRINMDNGRSINYNKRIEEIIEAGNKGRSGSN
jgi:hypothetical protein